MTETVGQQMTTSDNSSPNHKHVSFVDKQQHTDEDLTHSYVIAYTNTIPNDWNHNVDGIFPALAPNTPKQNDDCRISLYRAENIDAKMPAQDDQDFERKYKEYINTQFNTNGNFRIILEAIHNTIKLKDTVFVCTNPKEKCQCVLVNEFLSNNM